VNIFEWTYLGTGLLGLALWCQRKILPEIIIRLRWRYFQIRFNRLFISTFLFCLAVYGLTKNIDYRLLLFITTRVLLGLGSIYTLLLLANWLVELTGINLDKTIAFLAFVAFSYLAVITVKDYIFPDWSTNTQLRLFSLAKNPGEPILVGEYHEHDPFTFRSDGDFIVQIQDDKGNLLFEQPINHREAHNRFHSIAESGLLYIKPIPEVKTNKVNFAVIHHFDSKKLGIRNHWFIRHAIPYCFLLTFVLLFTPKNQYRRLLMSSFSDDNLPKKLNEDLNRVISTNPIDAARVILEQFFRRIGYAQMRFTANSKTKLFKQATEALRAKYEFEALIDFNIIGSDYEAQHETNKTKTAEQKWKRRRYEGTETEADQEWADEAKKYYQFKSAQRFKSKEELEIECSRLIDQWTTELQERKITKEQFKKRLQELEEWKKREIENLESQL